MAYSTIPKPSVYFNTKLYTGNGGTQSITGVGFQPDMVWTKSRGNANNHNIFDAIRGATKRVFPNSNSAETTTSNTLTAFDSDGFSLGSQDNVNASGITMASWNWKANGTGSANTNGTINSTVSVNTTAGFSIVKYTANQTAGATIGHGLGVAPKMIILKGLEVTENWIVYHGDLGNGKYLQLNENTASTTASNIWNDTSPTSSVFSIGNSGKVNNGTDDYIAYCFAEKKGYSKFGSYTGNGNADGTFVYTGFKPAFVMIKVTSRSDQYWQIKDVKRDTYNQMSKNLYPNVSDAEGSTNPQDFLSNGFKTRTNLNGTNGSGETYIYMAFAEEPLVANSGTDGVPATAR